MQRLFVQLSFAGSMVFILACSGFGTHEKPKKLDTGAEPEKTLQDTAAISAARKKAAADEAARRRRNAPAKGPDTIGVHFSGGGATGVELRCRAEGIAIKQAFSGGNAQFAGLPSEAKCELVAQGGKPGRHRWIRPGQSVSCQFVGVNFSCN